jgi:prepilin-type N-terminal cleavage/methylation domain-containing protein
MGQETHRADAEVLPAYQREALASVGRKVAAMERFGNARRGTAGGFTLVELLVVMGIIGLLIGLLIPAINYAITAARCGATKSTIAGLSTGLYAFKADWGIFPPSRKVSTRDGVGDGNYLQWTYGFEALPLYLIGPQGNGWGAGASKVSPFLTVAVAQCGPYYQAESPNITVVRDNFPALPQSIGGGATHSASGCILYYRFEPNEQAPTSGPDQTYTRKLAGLLDYQDNSPAGTTRPEQGFCSQNHFLLSVVIPGPTGGSTLPARWRSEDFVLISSGPDRAFGTVKMGADGALMAVTSPTDADGTCDDITSFNK